MSSVKRRHHWMICNKTVYPTSFSLRGVVSGNNELRGHFLAAPIILLITPLPQSSKWNQDRNLHPPRHHHLLHHLRPVTRPPPLPRFFFVSLSADQSWDWSVGPDVSWGKKMVVVSCEVTQLLVFGRLLCFILLCYCPFQSTINQRN